MIINVRKIFGKAWNSNVITTWAAQGVSFSKFFLLTPLILTRFSAEQITVWYLFGSITMFAQLLDLGLSPTFTRFIAYAHGGAPNMKNLEGSGAHAGEKQPNWSLIQRLYQNSGFLYVIVSIFVFIIIGGVGTVAMRSPISVLQSPGEGWTCWGVVLIGITLTSYLKRYQVYLIGLGHLALCNRFEVVFSGLSVGVSMVVVVWTNSFYYTMLSLQLFIVLGGIRAAFLAQVVEGARARQFKSFRWEKDIAKHLFEPSWKTSISLLAGLGLTHLSGLILVQYVSAAQAAPFLFAQRIIGFASQVLSTPVLAFRPEIPRLRAQGKLKLLSVQLQKRMLFSLTAIAVVLYPLGVGMPMLLKLIGSNIDFIEPSWWFLMIFFLLYDRQNSFNIMIQNSTNTIRFHWYHLACLGASAVVIMWSVPRWGVPALILSIGIVRAMLFNSTPVRFAAETLKISAGGFFFRTYALSLLISSVIFILYFILSIKG